MHLRRLEGWEGRLAVLLAERQFMPFVWGTNCCASFAIAAVDVVTGEKVWPVTWRTAAEAAHVIASAGGLELAAASVLGPAATDWRRLRRADVALVETAGRYSLAICTGQSLCAPGADHLEHLPLDSAIDVWRIG